jgi:RimJ/RimL family protein N-acetyltransferase
VIRLEPTVIEGRGLRLEPLTPAHREALVAAASDGALWELRFTTVPRPDEAEAYIAKALDGQRAGHMLPWAVRELASGAIVGSTRYHDAKPEADRVEIGYTWYAKRWQRSFVNTACKLLLLEHAFDRLGCAVVGWRTDILNVRSQAAIEALGAHKDGVVRREHLRRDGTIRDTVMYSMLREEWPEARAHLEARAARHASQAPAARSSSSP